MFSNNLIKERKKQNLTQEDLAEKLNVSRQAVTKWESGKGYPEMDKIIELSKIFNCSIDDLLKGDIKEENPLKEKCDKAFSFHSNIIGIGVFLIIMGVSGVVYSNLLTAQSQIISSAVLLVLVAIAVGLFIYGSMTKKMFLEKYDITGIYTKEEKHEYLKKHAIKTIIGVMLIILGVAQLLVFVALYDISHFHNILATGILMNLIAVAVYLFVSSGIIESKFDYKSDALKTPKEKLTEKITGIIMLSATMLYLFLGFAFDGFGIYWYIFPIAGIICAIISTITGKDS